MMNIRTSSSFDQDKVLEIIASFADSGKTYWEKRNTIKVFDTEHGKWNVKSFQVPHLINRFAYKYVRKSKARRSFEHAEILLSKGILTPSPIAYAEYSNIVGLTNSFYVSENLEYDFNFEKVIDPNFPDRENILRQFAQFTFKLHENRIHHFDHSKGNTLMCKTGEGAYEFYLIDLNRMRFEDMSYEMRIDNFNRLSLTEDMIQIIGNEYASIIGKDSNQVTEDIRKSCQKFDDYTVRKSRWKKRIGKS